MYETGLVQRKIIYNGIHGHKYTTLFECTSPLQSVEKENSVLLAKKKGDKKCTEDEQERRVKKIRRDRTNGGVRKHTHPHYGRWASPLRSVDFPTTVGGLPHYSRWKNTPLRSVEKRARFEEIKQREGACKRGVHRGMCNQ